MISLRHKIRIFWILGLGIVFIWLIWMKIVPGGTIEYVYDFSSGSDFISKLGPADRVEDIEKSCRSCGFDGPSQKIIGDPVYFSLRTPRSFDSAEVTIKYRNPSRLPLIELGVLVDGKLWRHKLEPIENRVLDVAYLEWNAIKEGDIMFLQKNRHYANFGEFMKDLPESEKIGVYNYDLKNDYQISEYKAGKGATIKQGIKGAWQFYTYIKDEDLDLSLSLRDLNLNSDPDPISLFVYYGDTVIDSRAIEDLGGNKEGSGEEEKIENLDLELAGLPEGVYKVELRANGDIVTDSISTAQSKIAFIGKLEFAKSVDSAFDLFTDSQQVQFVTPYAEGRQNIWFTDANSSLNMNETFKQFVSPVLAGVNKVSLERGALTVSGDGTFSFTKEAFFDPKIKKVNGQADLDKEGIEYIIADYDLPEDFENWRIATVDFDLRSAYREDGKYGFLISIPGLRADDDKIDKVEIGEIRIRLKGKPVWEKIREILNFK